MHTDNLPDTHLRCYICKEIKPLSEFYFSKSRKKKRQTMCKKCRTQYANKWYWAHRDEQLKRMHEFRQKNKERLLAYDRAHNAKIKLMVLQKVSGQEKPACVNCGCDDVRCLEVNHKNGGGRKEQQSYWKTGGYSYYRAILCGDRQTDDLNVLCKVCNNLHALELKYGKLPFKVIWTD